MKTVFSRAFLSLISIFAWEGTSLHAEVQKSVPTECSKELLLSYFPEPFVKEILQRNQIPEDKWIPIIQELLANDKNVISRVEARGSALNPNPLKSPEYRQQAITIFRETLLDIFTEVMNKNGINDKEQIQTMLDEVQRLKAKRFAKCMEKTNIEAETKVKQE